MTEAAKKTGDFNPNKDTHSKLKNKILSELEEKESIRTPEFEKHINYAQLGWGQPYFRHKLLPDTLKHLEKQGQVNKKEKQEGGIPTNVYTKA